MNIELDKDYIKSKIQEILDKVHPEHQKRVIRVYPERFNFACPICGDSQKNVNAKRGNLYFKNMQFICFNEDQCSRSLPKLLNTFDIQIDLQKKMDIYNYIDANIKFNKKDDNFVINKLDKLVDIDFMTEKFNNDPSIQFSNFLPIQKNSAQYQYLKYDRLIENFENIYQADFSVTPRWSEKVIIMLNKSGKKVLGIQLRNLKSGDKRLFKIFNFEKLYNMLHTEEESLDPLEAISYNKISNFYNILNVDWDKPVTIFEGYLDSIFYPNSIGAIGLNAIDEMSFLMSEDLDLQFFFDQDNIGVRKASTMLDAGNKVFLWQKLVEKLLINKTDKYKAKRYLLKIKDLNSLVQEMKNTEPYSKLKLYKFFSNDYFDKLYLDYTLYPSNKKPWVDYKKQNKNEKTF